MNLMAREMDEESEGPQAIHIHCAERPAVTHHNYG